MGLKEITDAAKAELIKNSEIRPKIIALKNGEATFMFLEFPDSEQKEIMRQVVVKKLKEMQPDEYFFISEAWVSREREDRIHRQPRRDIDRKEAIMIMEYHREMKDCKTSQVMFEKKRNQFVFEKQITDQLEYVGSPWDIWHESNIGARINEHDQKLFRKWAKEIKDELYGELVAAKTPEEHVTLLKKTIQRCQEKFKEQQKTILEDTDGERGGR